MPCPSWSSAYIDLVSHLPPVPCRADLASIAESFFAGRALELGVFHGVFSAQNLKIWRGEYVAVDVWAYRERDAPIQANGTIAGPLRTRFGLEFGDKNFRDSETNEKNYAKARKNIEWAGSRATVLRMTSEAAAQRFANATFSWIYIDALHSRDAVSRDLETWWPKLRSGGLLSGDDFGDASDTPMLRASRWERTFGTVAGGKGAGAYAWGTVSALQAFAKAKCATLHVTYLHDCYPYPAWYLIKPF